MAHINISKFAMMLHCSTTEFKQKEIIFLKSNRSFCFNSEISKRVLGVLNIKKIINKFNTSHCMRSISSHTFTAISGKCAE